MGDRITIENGTVILDTEEGQRFEHPETLLSEMLRLENTPPWASASFPTASSLPSGVTPSFSSFTSTRLTCAACCGSGRILP